MIKKFFTPTIKDTFWTLLGNGINSFFTLISVILVARVLSPEEFGYLIVAFTFGTVLYDVFGFGLEQGLIRFISLNLGKGNKEKIKEFLNIGFKLRLFISLLIIIVGLFSSKYLSLFFYKTTLYQLLFMVMFFGIVGTLISGFFSAMFLGYQKFFLNGLFTALIGIFRIIFVLLLINFNYAYIFTFALAAYLPFWLIAFLAFFLKPAEILWQPVSRKTTTELFHFTKWLSLLMTTATIHTKLDILMLARLSTPLETGIYSAASRLSQSFNLLISSFGTVLGPKMAKIGEKNALKARTKKIFFGTVLVIIFMLAVILFASFIIPLLFGREYASAIFSFQILMLGMILFMLATPIISSLYALGKSKVIGLISLCQLILVLSVNLYLIPLYGGVGAAIAFVLSQALSLIISSFALIKIYHE